MAKRARKKPPGIREPGESDVLPGPDPEEELRQKELGDWAGDDIPDDLKEAAIDFDNLKTKAENATEKFEEAKHELNRLRRLYNVQRVRVGTSTKFITFADMATTRFKIVKMNKPQAVVDAERDNRAGDVE